MSIPYKLTVFKNSVNLAIHIIKPIDDNMADIVFTLIDIWMPPNLSLSVFQYRLI